MERLSQPLEALHLTLVLPTLSINSRDALSLVAKIPPDALSVPLGKGIQQEVEEAETLEPLRRFL